MFPKQGRVRYNIEALPRTQKELELVIGRKFVRAMAHFHQVNLDEVEPVEGEGDLVTRRDDGTTITIQMAEAVDQITRRIRDQRETYVAVLLSEYPEVVDLFSGCRVTIVDNGSEPLMPRVGSKQGLRDMRDLVAKLRGIGESLQTLQVGKIRVRKLLLDPSKIELRVMCERIVEIGDGLPSQITWTGGYITQESHRRTLIANVVEDKIRRGYTKPEGEYWLVVYSSDIIPRATDAEIVEATSRLKGMVHPFDQAWFIFPYPNWDLGHIVRLWP